MARQQLELTLEAMSFGPQALGQINGKKIFVPWGVPQDKVLVEITEEKKDFAVAKIIQLLAPSAHRTLPQCQYFFKCGGCHWQHIDYESQLKFKTELLIQQLKRIAKISSPTVHPAIAASTIWNYRNRIRLQVSSHGEVGFFRHHSNELIPIENCSIADFRLNEKLTQAKMLAQQLLKRDAAACHEIEMTLEPSGQVSIREVRQEASAFVQAHSIQNQILQKQVLQEMEVTGSESVLELYAGGGNFTFPLAKLAGKITAIESNTESVQNALLRTQKEHRKNITWIESTAYRGIETLAARGQAFDRLLLDPPRKGAIEVIESLSKLKIPKIVYISCDPATLSRDLQQLLAQGYQHRFSQVIDLFPQTYHLESITVLEKP